MDDDGVPASVWIRENASGVRAFLLQAVETLARAAYARAIEALPWRRRSDMEKAVPMLVAIAVVRARDGVHDPVVMGNADAVLPCSSEALNEEAIADVHAHLGRAAHTMLEFYEAVHTLTTDPHHAPSAAVVALAHELLDL